MLYEVIFYLLAIAGLASAIMLVTRTNPLVGAVCLFACLLSSAGLFAMLQAPFLAVIQVLISAGGVVVLFIIVIMLVDIDIQERRRAIRFGCALGAIAAAYLAIVLALSIMKPPFLPPPLTGESYESTHSLGKALLYRYPVPFEIVGILLLVAAVSAVVLVKGRRSD